MLDPQIVKYINLEARAILKAKDENFLNATWDSLTAAFQMWKLEHGNRDVKYKTRLLGLGDTRKENKINSFDEAEPWECARLEVPSRIGLALKLYKEKYRDYLKIVEEVGPATIFALLITRRTEPCSDHDFFFAYAIMAEQTRITVVLRYIRRIQQEKLLIAAGEKRLENLAKGRIAAGKRKSERAREYRETWKKWAREAWENGPLWWTAEQVLDKVCSLAEQNGHKMANGKPYSRKTIQLAITGIKRAVRTQH